MAVFQTKKILSISAFIIVLIVILWIFQDNITKIYMLQQNIQQSDNIKEEINEAAYLEKIDNFVIKEYSNDQLLLHIVEAETYFRKTNKPVELLNIKLTIYDEIGQEGVILTANRAEIRNSGDIFLKDEINIQSNNGVLHEITTESLIVLSNSAQIISNSEVAYLSENGTIRAQGMEMSDNDNTMSLVGDVIIEQDLGGVITSRNLFISHADGEKHYESKERTIYRSEDSSIIAEMGMDLDMSENLMKFLGEVEVLNSSGSTMNSYDLIVDQSNGGEVYKTNGPTHYQTQVSDIRAKRMYYDAKTKKVELTGGVQGIYE
jgi:LPS export ABC transporter protein LptC